MILTTGRNGSGPAAFTLLELILVMALICTILAITAPSLRGFFAAHQAADAAAQIVALTQYARTQAAAEGRTWRLNLDAATGTYWLTVQDGAAFVPPATEFGRIFSLPEGAAFDASGTGENEMPKQIDFRPTGTVPASVVRLIGRQHEAFEVRCLAPSEPFSVVPVTVESRP